MLSVSPKGRINYSSPSGKRVRRESLSPAQQSKAAMSYVKMSRVLNLQVMVKITRDFTLLQLFNELCPSAKHFKRLVCDNPDYWSQWIAAQSQRRMCALVLQYIDSTFAKLVREKVQGRTMRLFIDRHVDWRRVNRLIDVLEKLSPRSEAHGKLRNAIRATVSFYRVKPSSALGQRAEQYKLYTPRNEDRDDDPMNAGANEHYFRYTLFMYDGRMLDTRQLINKELL